jgi:excisionase family DNA binding protein
MNAEEAAIYLGFPSKEAIYKAVQRGHLPAHRVGPRLLRFRKSELDRKLQRT